MRSVADTFFYEELCASMGQQGASNWLLKANASKHAHELCASTGQQGASNWLLRANASKHAHVKTSRDCCKWERPECVITALPSATGIQSQDAKVQLNRVTVEDADINKLANQLGVSPGLIFTDAAHILLDRQLDLGYHPESHPCGKELTQHLRMSQRARARSS